MHYFPCTPDCPLEIYADWLEDHDIDPTEVRLLAQGWLFIGVGVLSGRVLSAGCGYYRDDAGNGSFYRHRNLRGNGNFYTCGCGSSYGFGFANGFADGDNYW